MAVQKAKLGATSKMRKMTEPWDEKEEEEEVALHQTAPAIPEGAAMRRSLQVLVVASDEQGTGDACVVVIMVVLAVGKKKL